MARVWLSGSRESMNGTKRFRETSSSVLKRNFYTYRDRAGGVFLHRKQLQFRRDVIVPLMHPAVDTLETTRARRGKARTRKHLASWKAE